jgi:hypothetical protein
MARRITLFIFIMPIFVVSRMNIMGSLPPARRRCPRPTWAGLVGLF